jgi:hypothetical protein
MYCILRQCCSCDLRIGYYLNDTKMCSVALSGCNETRSVLFGWCGHTMSWAWHFLGSIALLEMWRDVTRMSCTSVGRKVVWGRVVRFYSVQTYQNGRSIPNLVIFYRHFGSRKTCMSTLKRGIEFDEEKISFVWSVLCCFVQYCRATKCPMTKC